MSWVETTESQRCTADALGIKTAIRVYRVWNYSRTQILNDPTAIVNDTGIPLPAIGSIWEDIPLRKYSVVPVGNIFDVTAEYTNDLLGNGPLQPNFVSWSNSFGTKDFPIPYGRKARSKLYIPNPSAPLEPVEIVINGWNLYQQPIVTKVEHFICRANFTDAAAVRGVREAIRKQVGKLHKIGGLWSQFEGGDFAEQERNKWEIQYNWSADSGCTQMAQTWPPTSSLDPWFPRQEVEWPISSGQLWIRPPFHSVIARPGNLIDPEEFPDFVVFLPFDDSDPLGWRTLPGVAEPP